MPFEFMVKIYGITYGDHKTDFIEYRNEFKEKLWRFENNCMIDIIDNYVYDLKDNDYLGIFSCKFSKKTGLTKEKLFNRLNGYYGSAGVINCSPSLGSNIAGHGNFMDWSEAGHKGIKEFIKRSCCHVGLTYNNNLKHIIYANQFIARKDVYHNYINEVIKPCLELLEGEMWQEVNTNPGYTRALPGVYYNYIPFILERMAMQYFDNKKMKIITVI